MVDLDTRETEPQSPRRRSLPIYPLVAAAVVILCAGLVWLLARDDDPTGDVADDLGATAFDADFALARIDAYFAAYDAGDLDGVLNAYTPDASLGGNIHEPSVRPQWEARLAWYLAGGRTTSARSCDAADTTDREIVVVCSYLSQDAVARAAGLATPVETRFTVTPDGISEAIDTVAMPDYADIGEPFSEWLESNHPEEAVLAGCCEGESGSLEEALERGEAQARMAEQWSAYLDENPTVFFDGTNCGYRGPASVGAGVLQRVFTLENRSDSRTGLAIGQLADGVGLQDVERAIIDGDIADADIEALFEAFGVEASQAVPESRTQIVPRLTPGTWFLHCFTDLPGGQVAIIASTVVEVTEG